MNHNLLEQEWANFLMSGPEWLEQQQMDVVCFDKPPYGMKHNYHGIWRKRVAFMSFGNEAKKRFNQVFEAPQCLTLQ